MIKIKYNDSNTFEEVTFCRVGNLVTITPTDTNKKIAKGTSITVVMHVKSPTNDYTLSKK